MIMLVCLLVGIGAAIRLPKVNKLTIDDYPGTELEKFNAWHSKVILYNKLLLFAGFGVFVIQLVIGCIMCRMMDSDSVSSKNSCNAGQVIGPIVFFGPLIWAGIVQKQAVKLKKEVGIGRWLDIWQIDNVPIYFFVINPRLSKNYLMDLNHDFGEAEALYLVGFHELVDNIINEVHPIKVMLFGSEASGKAGIDSDIDILVVVPDAKYKREADKFINYQVQNTSLALAVGFSTPYRLEEQRNDFELLYRTILGQGKELYATLS